MVDTTIPGQSAEIVAPDAPRPEGIAGTVAIIGNFEKGDSNSPYFVGNGREAARIMGSSKAYSGSNIINLAFKQDPDNNNYGATDAICVQAGTRTAASATLLDSSSAICLHLTAVGGGLWANGASTGLKVSVATGTLTGTQKLIVKLNGAIVETWDNCANPTELMNKINGFSQYLTATGTAAELARTMATVTDTALSGGTETAAASITTTMLSTALATLKNEDFDIGIFTDVPDPSYIPTIAAYLVDKLGIDKASRFYIPLASSTTPSQIRTTIAATPSKMLCYFAQTATIGGDELNEAEFVARLAGFRAGMPVGDSMTNKIINDIDSVSPLFDQPTTYSLVDSGLTILELKTRKDSLYGVVSAVTGSLATGDDGKKTNESEEHAMATLCTVINELDLQTWLGSTGISTSLASINGEVGNRITAMVDKKIVEAEEDVIAIVTQDPANSENAFDDVAVRPKGILKHIHHRFKLVEGGT
jgi:hypothetical protein